MCTTRILFLFSFLLLVPLHVQAQDGTAKPATITEERQEALAWLESYVGNELLLTPEDLQRLISQIKKMPDAGFQRWYEQTGQLREMLESPEWLATKAWMKDFLNVQAVYSEQEIAEFRADVAKMTPSQLMEVMRRIERKHQSLIAMRQASQQNRSTSMGIRNELASAQRAAQVPAGGGRFGSRNVQSYFGPASSGPVRTSYAQRKNSYRRNFSVWPGGSGWWRW